MKGKKKPLNERLSGYISITVRLVDRSTYQDSMHSFVVKIPVVRCTVVVVEDQVPLEHGFKGGTRQLHPTGS